MLLGSKPLRHATTYVKKVAAGNIADGQLLHEAFQRGGFPLVVHLLFHDPISHLPSR